MKYRSFLILSVASSLNKEREKGTLWVGHIYPDRGLEDLKQRILDNPEQQFIVCGSGHFELLPNIYPNMTLVPNVPHTALPQYYNRYTDFLYSPLRPETFCRIVAEALLCGINMDLDGKEHFLPAYQLYEKVGMEKFRDTFKKAPEDFYNRIGSVLV